MAMLVGKQVGRRLYLHKSACGALDEQSSAIVARVLEVTNVPQDSFNVLRLDDDLATLALLDYPNFFEHAVPSLARSWKIDLATGRHSHRTYEQSLNPPVLHRKELLLESDDPRVPAYRALTAELEKLGLFDDAVRIGFRRQWDELLRQRGFRLVGHQLVPIGNVEEISDGAAVELEHSFVVARHLTALVRTTLSAPIQLLLKQGLLEGGSLFDYGCGRGSDLSGLGELGIQSAGWDPYYLPDAVLRSADVVNLGFVINVIEDPVERREALARAWSLADRLLVVSAMIASEGSEQGLPYADGIITSRRTFQKYYTQAELRDYITSTLNVAPISLVSGIFFVFKDELLEQRFQSGRFRTRLRFVPKVRLEGQTSERPSRKPREDQYDKHKELVDVVWSSALGLGREPFEDELPRVDDIRASLGSVKRAYRLAIKHHDPEELSSAQSQRMADLRVFLALNEFQKKPPYKQLEVGLQRDIRAFFGTYTNAALSARDLLQAAASPENIEVACERAAEQGLGFLIPHKSLEASAALVPRLPEILRVYVGCALVLYEDPNPIDLVKIHIQSGKVSLMEYGNFDTSPLPQLLKRTKINLRTQRIQVFAYGQEVKSPLLYLKTRYMNEEDEYYARQLLFDEELQTISDLSGYGPSLATLALDLKKAGKKITGYRIVPSDRIPGLDDPCGRNFTYRNLLECGKTWTSTRVGNVPKQRQSYTALRELVTRILDPVIEYFGGIELTYGFCCPDLAKRIHGRIAPHLDQHAAHELKKNGELVCARKGAAVDFIVRDEDMGEVAKWIVENLPFDRLYFYGRDRPLHVSYGPENTRKAYTMVAASQGNLMPRPFEAT
jgi:DNA phosphorothioation-associated putative methyltransferase